MVDPYGIIQTGFNRKRLDLLLTELDTAVRTVFGDSINLSPEAPDGQINGTVSGSNADLWEILEMCYNAFNPSSAFGATLSSLVELNGLTRLSAQPSTVAIDVTGTPAALITAGSIISNGVTQFSIDADITIGGGGTASGNATATANGGLIGLAGTVTTIETPIAGWTTVTNPLDAQLGRLQETDVQLRSRRASSVAIPAQSVIDTIFANLSALTGVTQVSVLENVSDSVDSNGVPAHGFVAVVEGGVDADIGNAIWQTKPAGTKAGGNTSYVVTDTQGFSQTINFSRPTQIPIYVKVVLSRNNAYPDDGDDLVKQKIIDYAGGLLVEGEGFLLSEDVIQSRLFTPVNQVPGHDIINIFISTAPNPTLETNIVISSTEVSQFIIANIEV